MASPQHYLDNKEKIKARARAYYHANRERMLETKKAQQKLYYERDKTSVSFRMRQLTRGAKARAKSQDLPFDLTQEYVMELWERGNGRCCVTGVSFDLSESETYQNKDAPSLDKIIPSLGYVKGNVRMVTWHVNAAMLNHGLDTFLEMCQNAINHMKEQDE